MYTIKDFDKTALIFRDEKITYKELLQSKEKYSKLLKMKKEVKISIFAENRPEWIYTFLASWSKGGTNVLIDAMATSDEVAYILNDSDTEIIFTTNKNEKTLFEALKTVKNSKEVRIINIDKIKEEDFKYDIGKYIKSEDEVGTLIYTSGTTGEPKGVMLTMGNLMNEINNTIKLGMVEKSEKLLVVLPFHHIYPLTATFLIPMSLGLTLVFVEKLTGEEILKIMNKYKINLIVAVPRIFELFHKSIMKQINSNKIIKLLHMISKKIYSLKVGKILFKKVHQKFGGEVGMFISGGAKLDKEIVQDFWAMGFKILEGYGLTETAPIVALNSRWGKIKAGSVGPAIPETEIKIVNEEILIKSGVVMKGYYKRPDATKKVIKDGWFYTGDKGYIDNEGYLFVTGRKKDTILLSNGENVNPEELEKNIIKTSELIKEIAVIEYNNQLLAMIHPDFKFARENNILNIEETLKWNVIDKYNLKASNYKKIGDIRIIKEELPKTRVGKIRRFKLKELLTETKKERIDIEEPNTEEYQIIKEYLKDFMQKEVYPDDHIELDLGMDSLDKVEFQNYIEQTFGFKINSEEMVNYSIIKDMVNLIEKKKLKIENKKTDWKELFNKSTDIELSQSALLLKLLRVVMKPITKFYFKLEVKGLENIPNEACLITPNHQSFLDAFLIVDSMNYDKIQKSYFLAKVKHFQSDFRKKIAKNSNILVVDINKDVKVALQKSAKLFDYNKNLILFPEGARSRNGKMMNFKKAFAILSKEKNVPVVPVVIDGAYEAYPIGSKIPKSKKIKIEYLKPIYPENMTYAEIQNKVQEQIQKRLENS
ncbi:MAG: long-chain fatty acid--CoA ligase [Fusobacteriia bacterium 4572_132]|nr:MAG: long-chain fatty acid--CoA ligase [Fusobacteriia bacterium 4572_132]